MYQKFQVSSVQIEIISNLIILSIMLLHHAEITNKTYLEIVEAAIGRAESNNSSCLIIVKIVICVPVGFF